VGGEECVGEENWELRIRNRAISQSRNQSIEKSVNREINQSGNQSIRFKEPQSTQYQKSARCWRGCRCVACCHPTVHLNACHGKYGRAVCIVDEGDVEHLRQKMLKYTSLQCCPEVERNIPPMEPITIIITARKCSCSNE
jgi:hypothetical protein